MAGQSSQASSSQASGDSDQKRKKNVKPADMPKVALGSTPSSAFMQRFLSKSQVERPPGVLPDLPCEIIQMIATHLHVDDVLSLRLACTQLETKSFWYFSNTCFREVRFMHSRFALEALVEMSKSRMSQYVRKLGLGPPSNDQGRILFDTHVGPRSGNMKKRTDIKADMIAYSDENRRMRLLGEDTTLIRAALQNLRSVTTLFFIEDTMHKIGCSIPHIRSFGRAHLCQTIGAGKAHFEKLNLDATQSMARIAMIACHAAAIAGLNLECIDASMSCNARDNRQEKILNGYFASPLDLLPTEFLGSSTSASTFANLSVLKVYIGARQDVTRKPTRDLFLGRFTKFLAQTPMLKTLRMTFGERNGAADLVESLTSSPVLVALEVLELVSIDVHCSTLIEIIRPLRHSLLGLKLIDLQLIEFDYGELLLWIRVNMSQLTEFAIEDFMGDFFESHVGGEDMEEYLDDAIESFSSIFS